MANDKTFKVKNGLLAQRYLLSAGTETAGSVGYNLPVTVYDGVSFSVGTPAGTPRGMHIKPDGTKMYVIGDNSDKVNEYNLSTAWDISTASYLQDFSVSVLGETITQGLFFKSDGTKLYILGDTNNVVYEYNLSTAWNISTTSYSQYYSVDLQESFPTDIFFKSDGTKMYVVGRGGDKVYEYNLSTAWDVSTSTYVQNFSVASQDLNPYGLFFKSDGTKMYVTGLDGSDVNEYTLSTAWNISTASYVQSFNVSSQGTNPEAVFFKPDGTKMYVVDSNNDTIYQYTTASYTQTLDLSTGTYFSFTPSGATEVFFTNPPASGLAAAFVLEINGDGSAITWPDSVKWHKNQTPASIASKGLYTFITTDGGTTYYGKRAAGGLA